MACLSNEKVNKLCMTGIYRCDPILEKLPSYMRDSPYHCHNWTFRVAENDGDYYMWDTYWGNDFHILLTDENFDKFELVFDSNDVEIYKGSHWSDYSDDDKWLIRLDSGGGTIPKMVIRKGAMPVKELVIQRLSYEITHLESQLELKRRDLSYVKENKIDLRYV